MDKLALLLLAGLAVAAVVFARRPLRVPECPLATGGPLPPGQTIVFSQAPLPPPPVVSLESAPPAAAPGLPAPGSRPEDCPVCGWSPCLDSCRLGLSKYDVERMREEFRDDWQGDGDAPGEAA